MSVGAMALRRLKIEYRAVTGRQIGAPRINARPKILRDDGIRVRIGLALMVDTFVARCVISKHLKMTNFKLRARILHHLQDKLTLRPLSQGYHP